MSRTLFSGSIRYDLNLLDMYVNGNDVKIIKIEDNDQSVIVDCQIDQVAFNEVVIDKRKIAAVSRNVSLLLEENDEYNEYQDVALEIEGSLRLKVRMFKADILNHISSLGESQHISSEYVESYVESYQVVDVKYVYDNYRQIELTKHLTTENINDALSDEELDSLSNVIDEFEYSELDFEYKVY